MFVAFVGCYAKTLQMCDKNKHNLTHTLHCGGDPFGRACASVTVLVVFFFHPYTTATVLVKLLKLSKLFKGFENVENISQLF